MILAVLLLISAPKEKPICYLVLRAKILHEKKMQRFKEFLKSQNKKEP